MTLTVLLGDEIELAYGKGLPQRSRILGRYPVFGSNGQVDTHDKPLISGPGIIVGRKGSVGEVIWTSKDFWPIDTTYYVKLKNPDDNLKYWYYQLKTLGLNQLNSHSAIPGLNRDVAYAKSVIKRSPDKQRKIADILGAIDEKNELNRKMNESLEQMGHALFKHYFIDNLEASSWPKKKLSDFADVVTGKGSTKSLQIEGGQYPLYGANGIMGTSDSYLFDEDLIMTGRVGTLGTVRISSGKLWASDNVLVIKPRKYFGYVYSNVKTFDFQSLNRGSTQPLVTQTDLKNQIILVPPVKLLDNFESSFMDFLREIQNNDKQNLSLVSLRDSLLPRLISGKVKV